MFIHTNNDLEKPSYRCDKPKVTMTKLSVAFNLFVYLLSLQASNHNRTVLVRLQSVGVTGVTATDLVAPELGQNLAHEHL